VREGTFEHRSFWSIVVTQFLGAFNDNAFKQLVLLLAVDMTGEESGGNFQAIATALFALPFILFSGFAGNLADRFSKTRVIQLCKIAEILVMVLGAIAFATGSMPFLLGTVFLMGAQSAFFGPGKYGILPEMMPRKHLSRANGVIMMTTFLSIILGMAAAGILRDLVGDDLYKPQLVYVALAIGGTISAFGIRRYPPAEPRLQVTRRPFGDLLPTLKSVIADRSFLCVVVANSYFWFLGGVVQQTINVYGRQLMGLTNTGTSLLLVSLAAGMAGGSVIGGLLSRDRLRLGLTDVGIALFTVSLAGLTWAHQDVVLAHVGLVTLGLGGGLYGLPLQTCVQMWPPEEEKGRVVAAVNFVNWIFIFLSAGYFALGSAVFGENVQYIPASLAVISVLVAIFLRPRLRAAASSLESGDAKESAES
jgi:acyl-[acyl-carrier-protein]-phospholipid O-acyltransferase/long-chain-fatty-acid--[acyl-carrier-protein] ligase